MDREVKELNEAIEQIWEIATNRFGLDPFPVRFEIVPATVMYEVGSYALPGRYSHWTFGKAYHRMKMMYDFGLSKIYEVVINSNPSYAFLLETNSPIQNKMVIAHVLGHVDFFKNNAYFSKTNRRMVDEAAMHARRMSEYEFKHGRKVVEEFLDAVLSIEEHIDPNFFIKKGQRDNLKDKSENRPARHEGPYDDLLSIDERVSKDGEASGQNNESKQNGRLEVPEKDLVYFIMKNSPILEEWQRDTMSMLHEEMEYFIPQMQTKIMNEGWACATAESLVLTEEGFIRFDDLYEAGRKVNVAGGGREAVFPITDFHKETKVPTIRINTRRGLTIEGAFKHRVLKADGSWAYLKDAARGDRIVIECGSNVWPKRKQFLPFAGPDSSLADVAVVAGVSAGAAYRMGMQGKPSSTHNRLQAGGVLDEGRAWLLGRFADESGAGEVPPLILRSPKEVVSAFLRGYFDAGASAGEEGIRLSSSSEELIRTVQIVLLNYGILSTRRDRQPDCTRLEITGGSARVFLEEIGFSSTEKQAALRAYVESHQQAGEEDCTDEIVSVEYGCEDVFDITVDEKHAYIANGFVNHNSIWHSRIMREMDLPTHDHLEFAELHAGVVSPHKGQLNPYYLGYKIFEDIEKRWDRPSAEDREKLGRSDGEGREKMFEVREIDNDTSFLRNYLTEELCEELDLFVYELVEEEEWTITEKRWERVRDQLVANMTNFGHPYIEVVDGDYDGNRELYLVHKYEKVELDMKYARKTLEYVYKLWGRDVHLETVIDDEPMVMHYDGKEHDEE